MRIVLTGGGTGGHIYPALALYRIWKKKHPDAEFLYIGSEKGLESRIVPENSLNFKSIDIQGFRRSLSLKNVKTIQKFFTSVRTSKQWLREFSADIVLGTGGFVCGPVVYAASQLGIPTVIHEQNSLPGLSNKFLAHYVDLIALCFEDARPYFKKNENKCQLIGNPRAQEVYEIEARPVLGDYGLDPDKETVLIFGGSRGALRLNEMVVESFDQLAYEDFQVLFVTGNIYYDELMEDSTVQLESDHFKTLPYIDNMPEVLKNISLIVGRSGATSLAEITALGLPAVLIPSPNVTGDHQTKNARSLESRGAAKVISESELTHHQFVHDIRAIMADSKLRQSMAEASASLGMPDAADRLMEAMLALVKEK